MQWWNEINNWFFSDSGEFVLANVVVPAVSIIVAGLLAAWIASAAVRRVVDSRDRELKASAIGALVDAAEQASMWHTLSPQEQLLSDRASAQADIQVRLLPLRGADVAANWSSHALREMKRNSAAYGYEPEPAVIEFRDQLVEWQHHPARMRKYFQSDLDGWAQDTRSLKSAPDSFGSAPRVQNEQFTRPDFDLRPAMVTPNAGSARAHANPVLTDTATQRVLENVNAVERGTDRAVS